MRPSPSDLVKWSFVQKSVRAVREYAGGDVESALEDDGIVRDAIQRRLETLGEVAWSFVAGGDGKVSRRSLARPLELASGHGA